MKGVDLRRQRRRKFNFNILSTFAFIWGKWQTFTKKNSLCKFLFFSRGNNVISVCTEQIKILRIFFCHATFPRVKVYSRSLFEGAANASRRLKSAVNFDNWMCLSIVSESMWRGRRLIMFYRQIIGEISFSLFHISANTFCDSMQKTFMFMVRSWILWLFPSNWFSSSRPW